MEVWLDRPGLLRWDIETKKHFAVKRAAPTSSKVPLYIEPSRIDVFTMCCFKRGGILVGGYAESSLLHSGAATHVKYAAHNNSTATIKAIEVSLTELVAFRAQGHQSHSVTHLFHKRLGADETSLTLEKINATEKDAVEDRIYRDLQHLGRTLEGETTRLDFTVPASARSSYNGSIIHVNHTFSIKVITTFGTANPMVTRDIQMYSTAASNSAPTDAETPSAPPAGGGGAWAPVVASAVVLPEMAVSKVATADVEHDNNQPMQYAVAATPSTQAAHYRDVAALVQAMQQTYDPCGEVDKYLRQGHRADDLQPEDLFNLFRVVTDGFDQQRLADTLAGQMRQLTCMKVARVAAGARAMFRREVVEKFLKAAPVSDPENAQLVKAELSAFEFMTVEKYFQGN
jgi:predicted Zn-ribbon and HTH transcriptional regulator